MKGNNFIIEHVSNKNKFKKIHLFLEFCEKKLVLNTILDFQNQ